MALLTVDIDARPEGCVAALTGELDLSTVEQLEREVDAATNGSPEVLALDLRALEFVDSSGLRLILRLHDRQVQAGNRLVVVNNRANIARLFGLTGTDKRLEIVGDIAEIA